MVYIITVYLASATANLLKGKCLSHALNHFKPNSDLFYTLIMHLK